MNDRAPPYCRVMFSVLAFFVGSATLCRADYGPAKEVKAVRSAERAAWRLYCGKAQCANMPVTNVVVVGDFATLDWNDYNSGGQSLLRKIAGRWHRIAHGGGAMNVGELERYGVPSATALRMITHIRAEEERHK